MVGNKIRSEADKEFIKSNLPGIEILGFINYDPAITEADLANLSLFTASPQTAQEVKNIYDKLISSGQQTEVKTVDGPRKVKRYEKLARYHQPAEMIPSISAGQLFHFLNNPYVTHASNMRMYENINIINL